MYVDKEIFSLCTYLDKIYKDEKLGSKIFTQYLRKEKDYDIVKKFSLSEINISNMDTLPEFLSYVWAVKRIYTQLKRLFDDKRLYGTDVAFSEIDNDDCGITEILYQFSRNENRADFKDYSKYSKLANLSIELENAVDRLETIGKPVFISDVNNIMVDEFLKGEFLVVTTATSNLKSYISEKQGHIAARSLFKKVIITNKVLKYAKG